MVLTHLQFGHFDPLDPIAVLFVTEVAARKHANHYHKDQDAFEDECDLLNQRGLLLRVRHIVEGHITNNIIVIVDFVHFAKDLPTSCAHFRQKASQRKKQHNALNSSHFDGTWLLKYI